uniref:Short chain dehydrogenase andI n=1 Tax=Emericella variicolor TaxID=1549217 RepID=ANDI_EMEVA|nr:RecName: Full=Short chain dehydrogenase andI; AltName: Full=Anditomin synthesis protein I [Aspergillus stellatus]BAP81863.1 AndI [Aspergillus stellatus]
MEKAVSQFKDFVQSQHHDSYAAIQQADHRGHVVAITGASSGIGKAIAVSYGRCGVSALVLIARRPLDDVKSTVIAASVAAGHSPPEVMTVAANVADETSIYLAATKVKETLGHIDILVNNAGRVGTWGNVEAGEAQDWWQTWEVNIKGVYLTTRAFIPMLLQGKQKTIVNIGSMGVVSPVANLSAYLPSKLALIQFTNIVALEYSSQGLVAFTAYPGDVATELTGSFPEAMSPYFVDTPELPGDSIAWLTQRRLEWLSGRFVSLRWDLPELVSRQSEIVEGDKLRVTMRV